MVKIVDVPLGMTTRVFALVGSDGVVLIDAGMPDQAERILEGLKARDVTPEAIRLVLITHGHLDHFGSAAALRSRLSVPVAVHSADARALREGVNLEEGLQPTSKGIAFLMRFVHFSPSESGAALEPDFVFDDAWRLDDYGVAGEVVPTPGHTPGSSSIFLDSGEAIVGDLVMGAFFLQQRPRPPMVAWDLERNRQSLRAVLARKPSQIYATHGGPFKPESVRSLL